MNLSTILFIFLEIVYIYLYILEIKKFVNFYTNFSSLIMSGFMAMIINPIIIFLTIL